jgi:hypothetical protein
MRACGSGTLDFTDSFGKDRISSSRVDSCTLRYRVRSPWISFLRRAMIVALMALMNGLRLDFGWRWVGVLCEYILYIVDSASYIFIDYYYCNPHANASVQFSISLV